MPAAARRDPARHSCGGPAAAGPQRAAIAIQVADGFLLKAGTAGAGASAGAALRPLLIEPWISAVPDVVVCEFGARLDANGAAAAADQILKARHRMHGSRFFAFTVARSMSGTPTPLAVHGGGHTKAWKAEFKVTAAKPAGQVEQTKARVEARKLEIADERRAGRIKCAADPPGGHEGPA